MSNVANKRNMSGAIPKKKGDPSSNRISKKSQFYTLRRYYQSFKKNQILWFKDHGLAYLVSIWR